MRRTSAGACVALLGRSVRHAGSSSPPGPPPGKAVAADDLDSFMSQHMGRAIDKDRMTPEAANYFADMMGRHTNEARPMMQMARQALGDQDPERFTAYQQQQFGKAVSDKGAGMAADKLAKAMKEEQGVKDLGTDGKPTGENYWMENSAFGDPSVPGDLKDEIFEDMRRDRPKDSPAFDTE
jgi:hypothetical protein